MFNLLFIKEKYFYLLQLENNKFAATQITTDWKGDSSSASLTLGNFDPIGRSGVGVFHYLQKVRFPLFFINLKMLKDAT